MVYNEKAAQAAEAKRKEELKSPKPEMDQPTMMESTATDVQTQTGITFLELIELRLDYVKAYNSKKFMKTLCKKASVKYFRFHAPRHSGASLMDACKVPIGSIQRILGHENRTTTEIYLHSIG